ncbi:MAG: hypothetical protein DRP63_06070 [Planctomycetota bacterium]|nr:MAG: hypothetical protein DRP63_06070 [Planctomycetota bacterium]
MAEEKKRKKVSFYKPFIWSGVLMGILSAAPYTELMNFFYYWWGFVGGVMATYILSRRYPYFNPVQGAVLGFLSGAVAIVIVLAATFSTSFLNISYRKKIYPDFIRKDLVKRLERVQMPVVRGKVLPLTKEQIELKADEMGGKASDWYLIYLLYTIAALAMTSILGGLLGGALFGKPAPKRKYQYVRRRPKSQQAGVAAKPQQSKQHPDTASQQTEEGNSKDADSTGHEASSQ